MNTKTRAAKITRVKDQIADLEKIVSSEKKKLSHGVGDRIKEIRKGRKLTQVQFSIMIGITRTQLTNIEIGNSGLTIQNLIMICLTFDISSDHILGIN